MAGVLEPLAPDLPAASREPLLPAGFVAGAARAGIKASGRPDLAVIATTPDAAGRRPAVPTAAVFTTNQVVAAPVLLSRAHLAAGDPAGGGRRGVASAIVSTSGCANAATGPGGEADQQAIVERLAAAAGIPVASTLALSTGVIGTRLPVERVTVAIDALLETGLDSGPGALAAAAAALMTTDTRPKIASVRLTLPDPDGHAARVVTVAGIAKGVGMIHPRMATMLAVVLTDATAAPERLEAILRRVASRTWNQLSVDGDTSTNDTVYLLASGGAGTGLVEPGSPGAGELEAAVEAVARDLARQQAADGEGATTLITCQVSGAVDDHEARAVARAVVASSLVKAAVHGRDPNWGRVAGAAGNVRLPDATLLATAGLAADEAAKRAGTQARLDPGLLEIAMAGHLVFSGPAGGPVTFDRAAARSAMDAPELLIRVDLGLGHGSGEAFGCDLSEAYVVENSEYTT